MVIISIVVVISIVVATNVPSDGHTCGYDITKCLRFERNMFKPKENVIKRKFNGVTMNMVFISLVEIQKVWGFFQIMFLLLFLVLLNVIRAIC